MNLSDLWDLLTTGSLYLASGIGIHTTLLLTTSYFGLKFSKKINSSEELTNVVKKEAKKLNLDPSNIDICQGWSAAVQKINGRNKLLLPLENIPAGNN